MAGLSIGNGLSLGNKLSRQGGLSRGGGLTYAGASSWYPTDLGVALLGFWDAERGDLITQSGGLVSSFRDVVAAYDAVQATDAAKPIYSATSFNGRPGLTFDGVDDELTRTTMPPAFPSGASPGEIWAVVDQTALGSDATTRTAVAAGGNSTLTARRLQRVVASSTGRLSMAVGNGSTLLASNNMLVDFYGRHVARGVVGATETQADCDGVAGTAQAIVPNTGTSRVRLGASNSGTATSFWQGVINAVLFTAPLTTQQAAQLLAWGNFRRGA